MITPTFFKLSIEGSIAHLIMNRPEKANGMNEAFWTELPAIVYELENNPSVRALIICGEGKHFSGGIDLSTFEFLLDILKDEPARAAFTMRQKISTYQHAFNALEQARFPVIAATHGVCMGAAVDLICACDIRIACSDTAFSIEEVNIGMAADVGTLQRLPKLIAPGIAKELAFTGRSFSAEQAQTWGLVNSVYPDHQQTLQGAFALAQDIANKSPVAIAGIKHAVDYARDHSVSDGLDQIATWNAGMLRMEDLTTAIQARKEKKLAVFNDLIDTRSTTDT